MPTWEEPSLWSVRDKSEMLSERRFAIAARMADFASNPSIDVVIPVRNHWELTRRCLELLKSQSASHSVVVVDNGSDDGTPAKIEASFPEVQVIELGANTGFSHACNRGVESGRSEIVVLLNNDVEPRVAFLEHLVAPFRDGNVGSVAALLLQPGEETIDSVGLCADPTLAGFPRLRGWPVGEAVSSAPVLSGPSGGGGAYRRLAWEEVGGLDEGVQFYGEDIELALRLAAAGWSTTAAPTAAGVHLGSATAGHRSAWQRSQGGFARGYFVRRYGLLTSRVGPRTLVTELIVIVGDALLSRDLSAARGRLAGWRAARGAPRRTMPPVTAYDPSIGLARSLRLRRAVYDS